jgi:hypothetical protein
MDGAPGKELSGTANLLTIKTLDGKKCYKVSDLNHLWALVYNVINVNVP